MSARLEGLGANFKLHCGRASLSTFMGTTTAVKPFSGSVCCTSAVCTFTCRFTLNASWT